MGKDLPQLLGIKDLQQSPPDWKTDSHTKHIIDRMSSGTPEGKGKKAKRGGEVWVERMESIFINDLSLVKRCS